MIDEFQDTNAVQLGILQALERDNLFAVGDEFQSIYRFRHADVSIFRDRAASLPPEQVRWLAVNFRSEEELLDVLNAAFAPELGERFSPLRAGRKEIPMDKHGALRLFALDPPAGPPHVELLVTTTQGWDERADELGLAQGGDQPWRRAEARLIADRLRTELEQRPPRGRHGRARARDRRACGCSRRRWRSRACRPTSSAAAATGPRSRSATAWRGCACSPTRRTRRRC